MFPLKEPLNTNTNVKERTNKESVAGVFSYNNKQINQDKLGDAPITNNPNISVIQISATINILQKLN